MKNRIEGSAYKWEIRRRAIVRASCFAFLVLSVLLAPSVSALTTLPPGYGQTYISNTACTATVTAPASQEISHTDYDSVYVRMNAWWDDNRQPGGPSVDYHYKIDAVYLGNHFVKEQINWTTPGTHSIAWYEFGTTVPNVRDGNSMTVTYIAWVDTLYTCTDYDIATFNFV